MKAYEWKPIEDLPADWTKLASSELAGLASVWREHYETIKDSKALKQFNERLRREWAIETGIIENLYYIDRGVTLTLIEKGIEASLIPHGTTDKPAELIVPILKDQEEVVTGLFDFVGQQRHLSTSYIKQLHQALTQHQRTTAAKDSFGQMIEVELLRGDWKKLPNNPTKADGNIHEYCPPEQVASEMDQLIAWHQEHLEKGIPPEVEAAWLHHRFTQIHPFQDGNGRMARTLASLIFLRAGLFPLIIHRDERDEYIDALEVADQGDLKFLIQFFSRTQKKSINQAVSLSVNILTEGDHIQQIIAAAATQLKERKEQFVKNQTMASKLGRISTALEANSEKKISLLADKLTDQLKVIEPYYHATSYYYRTDKPSRIDPAIYDKEVKKIANDNGYYANTNIYHHCIVLNILTFIDTDIVISFHSLGKDFSGVLAVAAFSLQREFSDKGKKSSFTKLFPLSRDAFQFTYNEAEEIVYERYELWIDEIILNGLNYWRQQL